LRWVSSKVERKGKRRVSTMALLLDYSMGNCLENVMAMTTVQISVHNWVCNLDLKLVPLLAANLGHELGYSMVE